MVGYFLEAILGLAFVLSFVLAEKFPRMKSNSTIKRILSKGREKFFDGAGFFSASVQIACMIVLVRKDFGISAIGFGGFTMQITWAVAVICILPLLYPLCIPEPNQVIRKRKNYRLFLFCTSWLPFCYTFISQMIGDFAPTQVGKGAGAGGVTIITSEEWDALTALCLTGVETLSDKEQKVLSCFGAAASILVSAYGLLSVIWLIGMRQWPEQLKDLCKRVSLPFREQQRAMCLIGISAVLIPLLTIPQLWGIVRLRGMQKTLSDASGSAYADNQWTFGQVTAVMLFAPVFTEIGYILVQEHRR